MTTAPDDAPNLGLDEVVALYCRAWSEPDPGRRLRLLEAVWAPEGTYTDPSADVRGQEALARHIGVVHRKAMPPGARLVESSLADHHHGVFRFSWQNVLADGTVAMEGIDFGELDAQGRIRRIVGFFGPLAPKAAG